MLGMLLVIVIVLVAIFAPLIATYDPVAPDSSHALEGPNLHHWFGTDQSGRDVFSRVVYGARISLRIGVLAVFTIMVIGVPLGVISGLLGGWVDATIMRIADVFLAFPMLVLALAVSTALGGGIQNVIIAVAFAAWPLYARLVRSVVIVVRRESYIEAARISGASTTRVIRRHVIPNSIAPIAVQASQDMGFVILLAASLGFIGIGVKIPTPEWGTMINDGREVFLEQWWVAGFPGIAIALSVLGFNLLGDGLRDILDPRSRS